ncbi:MAG: hypothetical protein IIC49_05510 [Planctomycetes bacterium]|nr:hypothetical protein [Planctomycetota bacterium]
MTTQRKNKPDAMSVEAHAASDTSDTARRTGDLAVIRTRLSADEILDRVGTLSQRGRLPGFAGGRDGVLFVAMAFGRPFDRTLEARAVAGTDGTELRFTSRLNRGLPWAFIALTAVSIWPGVWLTDSLLRTYFDWYRFATWMWYLPVSVVPLPWAVRAIVRRSETAAAESARELIERIRAAVDGHTEVE